MKKFLIFLLCIFVIGGVIANSNWTRVSASQESISDKIIRFHVIANSDTDSDQALKLKVRDKVLQYIYPKLVNSKSIDESRKILKANDKEIEKIAEQVLKENKSTYTVKTTLSRENFPVKSYGNITLPQGNYEAYRIIIGSGKGHNWWCVMFPPLCFIDITKGEVANKETEEEMKKVLNQEEFKLVDNSESNTDKIEVKFKIVEIFKSLFK